MGEADAAASSAGALYKLISLRKTLGFKSWAEVVFMVLTCYMAANFGAGFLGISLLYVGVFSVFGSAFAWYQLHLLGSLTERLEQFDEENKKLKQSVDTFTEQNVKLKSVSDRLAEENEKFSGELEHLQTSLDGLATVQQTLETYASENNADLTAVIQSLNDTLDEQKECVHKQSALLDQTKEATRSQEKILLMQLHAQCQFMDQSMGMSEQEFQMFSSMIPAKFRNSPEGLAFDSVDKDGDGVVSHSEFNELVDRLVSSVINAS